MGNLKIFVYTAPMETLISADVTESRYKVQSLKSFKLLHLNRFPKATKNFAKKSAKKCQPLQLMGTSGSRKLFFYDCTSGFKNPLNQ
jgi:hypothetical protein